MSAQADDLAPLDLGIAPHLRRDEFNLWQIFATTNSAP